MKEDEDITSVSWGDNEIAYSTKVQKELAKQVKVGNWLMLFLVISILLAALMMFLVYTNTGVIGNYLARAVC